MKIKIITCHEVYNYGASLQEFALSHFIENHGYEVEVIHYKPSYLSSKFNLFSIDFDNQFNKPLIKYLYLVAKLPNRLLSLNRKKSFDTFSNKYIKSGSFLYLTNEDLKNKLPEADVFICGSDQIWNSYFSNGKDPAFYLDFVPDGVKKISYAASFAIDSIVDDLKPFVKEKISRLDFVSVRETSAVSIVQDLGIKDVIQVLDPVFLLEKSYWKNEFVFDIFNPFILVYDFDSNPNVKQLALELSQKNNWKIYTVNEKINYADKNYYYEGPNTFLSLVYNAQIIISNSFHAIAFSLIFEKQFVVFNRNESINTRMRDLLLLFDLPQLLILETKEYDLVKLFVDYDLVNPLIHRAKISSIKFLLNSIQS